MECSPSCTYPLHRCTGICCYLRYTGENCKYDYLYYDACFFVLNLIGLGLVIYGWVVYKLSEKPFTSGKFSMIILVVYFAGGAIAKIIGVVGYTMQTYSMVWYFFYRFFDHDITWTSIITIIIICIFDWIETGHAIQGQGRSGSTQKYIPAVAFLIFLCFILGGLDSFGIWAIVHVFNYGFAVLITLVLGITFFITSQTIVKELQLIHTQIFRGLHVRLQIFRWTILGLAILLMSFSILQILASTYAIYDFEIFGLAAVEGSLLGMSFLITIFFLVRHSVEETPLLGSDL